MTVNLDGQEGSTAKRKEGLFLFTFSPSTTLGVPEPVAWVESEMTKKIVPSPTEGPLARIHPGG